MPNVSPPARIALALEELLDRQGLTQADLARLLGVSQAATSRWFNGQAMTLANLARACELLGAELVIAIKPKEKEIEIEQRIERAIEQ